jgi:hypothetical protein
VSVRNETEFRVEGPSMLRISVIASLAIGLSMAIAAAGSGQPDTPKEAPDQNWRGADVLFVGKVTKERDVSTKKDMADGTWRFWIGLNPEKTLRGSANLDKALYLEYSVDQEERPTFPADKEYLIALRHQGRRVFLVSIDEATKANIELARNTTVLPPEPVTESIKLFNGKDLTNFYTWLGRPYQDPKLKTKEKPAPFGKNNDPLKVVTVVDGAIRVSGEVFGCFTTEKEYENYHLL